LEKIGAKCAMFALAIGPVNTYLLGQEGNSPKDNTPQRSLPWRMF
jgi:hypothetical protein